MTRVAVVTGGSTPERDVAFAGAAQVVGALRGRGYEVPVVDTVDGALTPEAERRLLVPSVGRAPPTREALRALEERELGPRLVELPEIARADVVFLVLHGRPGEGGTLQAVLEAAAVPYAGSGPLGSALAMDKDIAKRLFRWAGVPTAAMEQEIKGRAEHHHDEAGEEHEDGGARGAAPADTGHARLPGPPPEGHD